MAFFRLSPQGTNYTSRDDLAGSDWQKQRQASNGL